MSAEPSAVLTLKIDTDQPIELQDFVGAFTSLENEFERFVSANYDNEKVKPRLLIHKVHSGSVVVELITVFGAIGGVLGTIMVFEDFVIRWGERAKSLLNYDVKEGEFETDQELKDWANTLKTIVNDPKGVHRIEAASFEDGKKDIRAKYEIRHAEATTMEHNIRDLKKPRDKPISEDYKNVLMRFIRSDITDVKPGKNSGEMVKIRQISKKKMNLVYASKRAEERIKHEIRSPESVYHKGFLVDVSVSFTKPGKPDTCYVTSLHKVINIDRES